MAKKIAAKKNLLTKEIQAGKSTKYCTGDVWLLFMSSLAIAFVINLFVWMGTIDYVFTVFWN